MGMLAYIGGYKAVTDTPVAKSQGENIDTYLKPTDNSVHLIYRFLNIRI